MGDDRFNNPFADMKKDLLKEVKKGGRDRAKRVPEKKVRKKDASQDSLTVSTVSGAHPKREDDREERLFREYMAGVKPIDRSNDLPPPTRKSSPRTRQGERAEAAAALYDLVQGRGSFDIEFLDEYVTGLAPGVGHNVLRRLKHGEFAIQAHIDLHGMYWDEARVQLISFFERARREGKRCVLVVHGRGLHSPEGTSTLKENLLEMLSHGPLSKHVLAFATARRVDGGPGAMYVLLRRNRTPFR